MNNRTDIPRTRLGLAVVSAIFGVILLLIAPVMAQTPDKLPQRVTDRVLALAYTHDLSRQEVQSLLDPMERAAGRDFPVEPLLLKMEEGLIKRVQPERIAGALENLVDRFIEFADILDGLVPHVPGNRDAVLLRMHGLSALGIGPEVIRSSLHGPLAPSMGQVLNALETKAGLLQNGIPTQDAELIVNSGMASGYFQESGWDLARLARAAGEADVPLERISGSIQDAVEGRKDIQSVAKELGVDLGDAPGRGRHGGGHRDGSRGMGGGQRGTGGAPGSGGSGGGNGGGGGGGPGSGGGSGGGPGGGGGGGGR